MNRLVGKENEFEVIIFGDKVILDEQVENWPVCDFLISFFSDGFPLEKAIAYAKLRKPFCVNDLPMQTILWDRRMCLSILTKLGVPTPARVEVSRDGGPVALSTDIAQRMKQLTGVELIGSEDGRGGGLPPPKDVHMEDDNDTLVVDGKKLRKPFVEKPTSGEDHNINIYYPKSQGGGGRKLFRKVNNKSSEKDENLIIPLAITEPTGSYIYEQFLKVENAEDVKAYTVGPDFCHAETRKSPVVDGVVKRNPNGKEIRYVTKLSKVEQEMAAKIATGFGQKVCGFDLLRVETGKNVESYVIDVNGWSFVKDNNDYYDNAAKILKAMFIREKIRWEQGKANNTPSENDESEKREMLPPAATDRESLYKKSNLSKDRDIGGHRSSLSAHVGSVFHGRDRSRSVSLREKVEHARSATHLREKVEHARSASHVREKAERAAHKIAHPIHHSPSGASSPLSSPASLERTPEMTRRPPTSAPAMGDELLPPPAVPSSVHETSRPNSSAGEEIISTAPSEALLPAPAPKSQWKLKGMVAVIRHADRTPKQKFKFTFHTKPFADLLKGHQEEVLLVGEAALFSVQQAVRQAMAEGVEDMVKLRTLSNALAKKGAWPGTKVQIKPMFKKPKKDKEKDKNNQADGAVISPPDEKKDKKDDKTFADDTAGHARAQNRSDSMGEITMSRATAADENLVLDKLQLVMKWGGEPTHSARYQATDLGENMRNDLLLMNRRVLDNVSIYTSSERRVTTSAQIFAAAFLDQKEIAADEIQVRKDLLDDSNAAKDEMDKVKKKLKGLLREGHRAPEQFAWPKDGVTPEPYVVVRRVVELMKFHRRVMRSNFTKLQGSEAVSSLEKLSKSGVGVVDPAAMANGVGGVESQTKEIQPRWCTGEDAELFKERWEKLFNEFTDAEKVDPSKISELYDTMKFDALHNRQFLEWVFTPSKSFLKEEGEGEVGGLGLRRTESQIARDEFQQTHNGQVPSASGGANGEGGMETLNLPPPKRTDTMDSSYTAETSTTSKSGKDKDKEKEGRSFSERLGFRRKSADLLSKDGTTTTNNSTKQPVVAAAPAALTEEQSYFNLYRGTLPPSQNKVRTDQRLEKLNEMYNLSKVLFDFIGPQEYGITDSEKLEIGLLTSLPLLKEIVKDLEEVQASDDAKSFIYFTKESHIYTLLNCILEGGVQTKIARNAIPELDYLSQICFELYESANAAADVETQGEYNYSIRITISPGCHTFDPLDVVLDSKHCIGCAPRRSLTLHGEWVGVLEGLRKRFHTVRLPRRFVAVDLRERFAGEGGGGLELGGEGKGLDGVGGAAPEGKAEGEDGQGLGIGESKVGEEDGKGEDVGERPGGGPPVI